MVGGFEAAILTLLLAASVTDVVWGKVYNWLTFGFLILGLSLRTIFFGFESLGEGTFAVATAFALFFPLWRLSAIAAGDVKLLMAAAAWSTPQFTLSLAAIAIIVGAVVLGFVMFRQRGAKESFSRLAEHLHVVVKPGRSTRMPFAPAFFCAFVILKTAEHYQWHLF